MQVQNVHERVLAAGVEAVAPLLDGLSSSADLLWPHERWPAMRFDKPLQVGARGGHGPVRYSVEAYEPGRLVRFRFSGPKGFLGVHYFETEAAGEDSSILRHVIEMRTAGSAVMAWPLMFGPLHDALLEDALDKAEKYVGGAPTGKPWSARVRLLRWIARRAA